jgi:selenocysteine lyase/cysteine desulfurase
MIRQLESMPGVSVVSRTDPARLSGIVSFRADQTDQREVFKRLKKRGVITALRHRCIRLSPHFYQHGIPIQTLMDVVESALK